MQDGQPPSDGDSIQQSVPGAPPAPLYRSNTKADWTQIGAAFLAIGGAGFLGIIPQMIQSGTSAHNPWLWYIVAVSFACLGIGFYGVFGPFFGWRMPEPQPEYFARWRKGGFWLLSVLIAIPIIIHFATSQREFVNVSPSYLRHLKENRSTRDGDRLFAQYRGKWIRVTGAVTDISDSVGRLQIDLEDQSSQYGLADISAYFEGWFGNWFGIGISEDVKALRLNDKITANCAIDSSGSSVLFLESCEIVR